MKRKLKISALLILSAFLSITLSSCSSDEKLSSVNTVQTTESPLPYDSSYNTELTANSVVTTENIDTEPLEPYDFWKADEYRAKLTYDMDKFEPFGDNPKSAYEEKNKIERVVLRCRECGEFCNENLKYHQIVSSDIHSDEEFEKLNNDAQIVSDMWELSDLCLTYHSKIRGPAHIYSQLHFPDECRGRYNLDMWYMTDKDAVFTFADPETLEELSTEDILGKQWLDYVYNVCQHEDEKLDIRQADYSYINNILYNPDENILSAYIDFYKEKPGDYSYASAIIIVPGDKAVQKYLVRS